MRVTHRSDAINVLAAPCVYVPQVHTAPLMRLVSPVLLTVFRAVLVSLSYTPFSKLYTASANRNNHKLEKSDIYKDTLSGAVQSRNAAIAIDVLAMNASNKNTAKTSVMIISLFLPSAENRCPWVRARCGERLWARVE